MASSRDSGFRIKQLWQQARDPLFWLNADLKLVWVNRAWEELTGQPSGSVLGLVCHAHGPTRAGDLAGLGGSFYPPAEALAGRPAGQPTLIVHASGERTWRRVEHWPFLDQDGALLGLLGLVAPAGAPAHVPDAESNRLRIELLEVRDRLLGRYGFDNLAGSGPAHHRLLEQVKAAAAADVPVLIVGENGTGKTLVARTIHQLGTRHHAPFLPLDCAALPAEVLERELFGDGNRSVSNRLAVPDRSTLLLGDILDLPRDLQERLAALPDDRARLIATTAGDPEEAVRTERLRPDLYYALTTLVIRLRPLRERGDELPLLTQHFLERVNRQGDRQRRGFSAEALAVLLGYDWPGNLRELARVIDAAHARGPGDWIEVEDLPAEIRGSLGAAYNPSPTLPTFTSLDDLLTQVERRLIENALQTARQNKSRAAELLGISRPRLYRRIKELNLPDVSEPVDELPAAIENHS